ncbi:hypothetical protein [Streptomyces sp. JB150]|uniref:hypothetical protein n=1 Tax=Streptomyces sp. JB150 TaxID=2714844 RepID=UPI0014080945|nr:hypothetical protein [Streptomyces sp. JB150]QIJ63247.1 hypothetical protein G7Z13_15330 [Streptomyces sp. JB150]
MVEQQGQRVDQAREARRRRSGIVGFLAGLFGGLAFFGFFPGLPHVIDWGAIVVSVVVGLLGRWAGRAWADRAEREQEQEQEQHDGRE